MARPREIPYRHDWLRSYLARKGVTLPLEAPPERIERVCAGLSTPTWRALQAAWRQSQHRRSDRELHGWVSSTQRLGAVWRSMIRATLVTEADARILAEHGLGGGLTAWADPMARSLVAGILHDHAERLRSTKSGRSDAALVAAARLYAQREGITDPAALADLTEVPFDLCMQALAGSPE